MTATYQANLLTPDTGWDIQTYDNMVDNVTNGKTTILSNDVKGIMPLQ